MLPDVLVVSVAAQMRDISESIESAVELRLVGVRQGHYLDAQEPALHLHVELADDEPQPLDVGRRVNS